MVVTWRNGEVSTPSVAMPMHTISTAWSARAAFEKVRPADYWGMSLLAWRRNYHFFRDNYSEGYVEISSICIHVMVVTFLLLFLYFSVLIVYISSAAEHHYADCLIQQDWSDLPKEVVASKQQLCHTSKTSGGFWLSRVRAGRNAHEDFCWVTYVFRFRLT